MSALFSVVKQSLTRSLIFTKEGKIKKMTIQNKTRSHLLIKLVVLLLLLLSISILFTTIAKAETLPTRTGYKVAVHHRSGPGGIEPHYGVYFGGMWASPGSQIFSGPSGAYPAYSSNGWVGPNRTVMLVSKTWLWALDCSGRFGIPVQCGDRDDAWRHSAYLLH